MKVAVVSDSHDHFYNLDRATTLIKAAGINDCLHLGDFCAPGFVKEMLVSGLRWTCVWGNVDGAKAKIVLEHGANPNFDIAEESFRELEIAGRKVFQTHFPLLARNAAESGRYDIAFYGDNHTKKIDTLANGTVLANPGELAGFKSGQPSFGIWDTEENNFEIVDLPDFKISR